jgi:ParB-like chromosome segregation protein Spo0J
VKIAVEHISITKMNMPKTALKAHPQHQIQQIAESINAFGFNDPVAIDETGEIIEGAGRVLAAKRLKFKTIPVIHLSHLTEGQKRAYRIAHNKLTLNTGFDLDALRIEIDAILSLDNSLVTLTGFEQIELDDLLSIGTLPDLMPELTESLEAPKTVTCPHCGGDVHV